MKNYALAGAFAVVSVLMTACGDDTTEITEVVPAVSTVESIESAECTEGSEGSMAFDKSSATMYVCAEEEWVAMNGADALQYRCESRALEDKSGFSIICDGDTLGVVRNGEQGDKGEAGEQGKTGAQGEQGDKGEAGTGCQMGETSQNDETGVITVSITCGEASMNLEIPFVVPNANLEKSYQKKVTVRFPVKSEKQTESRELYEEIWSYLKSGNFAELFVLELAAALSLGDTPAEYPAFETYLAGNAELGEQVNGMLWVATLLDEADLVGNINKVYADYREVFAKNGDFNTPVVEFLDGEEQSMFFVDYLAVLMNARLGWIANCGGATSEECSYEYPGYDNSLDDKYFKIVRNGLKSAYALPESAKDTAIDVSEKNGYFASFEYEAAGDGDVYADTWVPTSVRGVGDWSKEGYECDPAVDTIAEDKVADRFLICESSSPTSSSSWIAVDPESGYGFDELAKSSYGVGKECAKNIKDSVIELKVTPSGAMLKGICALTEDGEYSWFPLFGEELLFATLGTCDESAARKALIREIDVHELESSARTGVLKYKCDCSVEPENVETLSRCAWTKASELDVTLGVCNMIKARDKSMSKDKSFICDFYTPASSKGSWAAWRETTKEDECGSLWRDIAGKEDCDNISYGVCATCNISGENVTYVKAASSGEVGFYTLDDFAGIDCSSTTGSNGKLSFDDNKYKDNGELVGDYICKDGVFARTLDEQEACNAVYAHNKICEALGEEYLYSEVNEKWVPKDELCTELTVENTIESSSSIEPTGDYVCDVDGNTYYSPSRKGDPPSYDSYTSGGENVYFSNEFYSVAEYCELKGNSCVRGDRDNSSFTCDFAEPYTERKRYYCNLDEGKWEAEPGNISREGYCNRFLYFQKGISSCDAETVSQYCENNPESDCIAESFNAGVECTVPIDIDWDYTYECNDEGSSIGWNFDL